MLWELLKYEIPCHRTDIQRREMANAPSAYRAPGSRSSSPSGKFDRDLFCAQDSLLEIARIHCFHFYVIHKISYTLRVIE